MSGPELAAQPIANIAPSAAIAFTAAAIYLSAGKATIHRSRWRMIAVLRVGYCVVVFARRNAYTAGVTVLGGCWGIAAGLLGRAVSYMNDFLALLGLPIEDTLHDPRHPALRSGFSCPRTDLGHNHHGRMPQTFKAFQAAHAVIRSSAPGWELSVTTTVPLPVSNVVLA